MNNKKTSSRLGLQVKLSSISITFMLLSIIIFSIISVHSIQESSQISTQFESMKGLVTRQEEEAEEADVAGENIKTNIENLNKLIKEQSESVNTSSSAIEEMTANIHSVTGTLIENGKNVSALAEASEIGKTGLQTVAQEIREIAHDSESVGRLKDITVSVKKGAENMAQSGGDLVSKTEEFIKISNQVVDGMNKIVSGAMTQIKIAVDNVNDMNAENNRNFGELKTETEKFKVHTGDEKKIVLAVDDEPPQLVAIRGMLEKDYEVITANSGQEALKLFYQGLVPHVIMLDLIMPNMDGWDTYQKIKQISNVHFVPITIYSSSNDPEDRARASEVGAVDFIKKPCKKDELLSKIESIVNKYADAVK